MITSLEAYFRNILLFIVNPYSAYTFMQITQKKESHYTEPDMPT